MIFIKHRVQSVHAHRGTTIDIFDTREHRTCVKLRVSVGVAIYIVIVIDWWW